MHERSYAPTEAVTGALVVATGTSILACAFIVYTFARWRRLRRHPSSLLVFRVLMDALFCFALLASHLYTRDGSHLTVENCKGLSFLTQFAALGAELYFGSTSVDLLLSVSNPFTDYRWNVVYYHVGVLAASCASALLLILVREAGRPLYGMDNYLSTCWVRNFDEEGNIDVAFVMLFMVPVVVIYLFSLFSIRVAKQRLEHGLRDTFNARLDMYRMSVRYVTCYILYWALAAGVFLITTLVDAAAPPDFLSLLVAIALGGRGTVALVVWFLTYGRSLQCSRRGLMLSVIEPMKPGTQPVPNAAKADNAADLRPYLNLALRKEILHYATTGIASSVRRANRSRIPDGMRAIRTTLHFMGGGGSQASAAGPTRRQVAFNVLELSREKEEQGLFDLEARHIRERSSGSLTGLAAAAASSAARAPLVNGVPAPPAAETSAHTPLLPLGARARTNTSTESTKPPPVRRSRLFCCAPTRACASSGPGYFNFIDYEPWLFRQLRKQDGIKDAAYIQSISRTKREKFGEGGASGAFLYFSTDERFIVKTLTAGETETLLAMLHDYAVYMSSHPHSLITRFYGCHALTMYGNTMYFVVMANVFTTNGATLHERYDLKGSWIGRHRTPIERGQRVECRYCGQTFRVGKDRWGLNQCPERPNRPHEPNTVLKDNDLSYKLRLSPLSAQALGDQISADTEFLRRHGITDYSLLLGIHRAKYPIAPSAMPSADGSSTPKLLGVLAGPAATTPRAIPENGAGNHATNTEPQGWGFDVSMDLVGSPLPSSPVMAAADHPLLARMSLPPLDSGSHTGPAQPQPAELQTGPASAGIAITGARRGGLPRRPAHNSARQLSLSNSGPGGTGTLLTALQRHRTQLAMSQGSADLVLPSHTSLLPPPPLHDVTGHSRHSISVVDEETASSTGWHEERAVSSSSAGPAHTIGNGSASLETLVSPAASRQHSDNGHTFAGQPSKLSLQRVNSMMPSMDLPHFGGMSPPSFRLHDPARANSVRQVLEATHGEVHHDQATSRGFNYVPAIPPTQDVGPVQPVFQQFYGGLPATIVEGPGIYYLGIIDVLQTYTIKKRLERFFKTRVLLHNARGLSAMAPDEYAARFRTRVIGQLIDGYHHREYRWDDEFGDDL